MTKKLEELLDMAPAKEVSENTDIIPEPEKTVSHTQEHTPEDIQNEKCITSNNNEQWLFREHNKIQLISVNEKVILSSPQMRLEATSQHLGIAKLPDYLCQSGGHLLNVKRIKLSNEPVALQLTVLYQSGSIAFKTRMFLEYFQSNIGSLS